ncbi:hypothetical protein SERLA73DRAFT_178603 [Serpula lacrymans var. lacrymans S7.3]|uniref:Uncharacterized protein n=2 Tax=Serpula lacrymans var. lacrymans TaxID=341189 RepID=F8PS97_SERL3|nr:uncharacterized protein SERLADRAFT_463110 [Serpula lacrymans var. lacrymans S7.9]EGO00710.1 hypothetical protein SERLA73DRAFT_178603 [Serpula lacrymans var. lacrymans S7.3]EGO26257.1 hypothetical protein SERLADRAFT_463110 [Serpula lacrymans var. lacrymans S7.9]
MFITFRHSTFARIDYANGVSVCGYVPPTTTWHVYLPAVLLHVLMYALTVYRVAHSTTSIVSKAFVQRFIEEGAPLYLIATATLLAVFFTLAVAGSSTMLPVIESYLTSAIITIAVCHALLSIRTLAAKLHVDTNWLLSHNELSRLRYRRGLDNAELLVEVGSQYEGDHVELLQIENGREKANEPGVPRLSKSCLATATSGEASAAPPRLSIQAV